MKQMIAAACAAWLAIAAPTHAQSTSGVVVELYTSQGCSSCPPADEILGRLSNDPRIIALSLHVDYWDYLGWKDKFASPKFTARQKDYAHFARDKMVYTPQIVVQGQTRLIGNRGAEVEAAIRDHLAKGQRAEVKLQRMGENVLITAPAIPGVRGPVRVQLVRFSPAEEVVIERGENAGKTITYHNVVKSWQIVGKWDGVSALSLEAPNTGNNRTAVILQLEGPSEILAAAVLR